jgi:hypothetical protein
MNPVKEFYEEMGNILKSHDLQELTETTKVSKVTMWRWVNAINSKFPDKDKVLRVLSHISGLDTSKSLADYYGGKISSFILQGDYSDSMPVKYSPVGDIQTEFIDDFYSYVIFRICGTKRGATENELINVIGNLAIKKSGLPNADVTQELINAHGKIATNKIKELISKEIIFRNSDGRFSRAVKDITFPSRFSVEYLPKVLGEMIKPEEATLGYNSLFSYTESISDEAAKELAKRTKEFFTDSVKFMNDNTKIDGTPYTIINFAERFWFDSLGPSPREEV